MQDGQEAGVPAGGLPDGIGRWHLLACLRGAAQGVGLTAPMLALLTHYVDLTRDQDWAPGAEPVVPVPLTEIAEAIGKSERQVRTIEGRLADAGFLTWRDSANHHRKGRRCRRTGALLWAYGPSLGPLRARAAEVIAAAAVARATRLEVRRLRLAIGALRRNVRAELAASAEPQTHAPASAVAPALTPRPAGAGASRPVEAADAARFAARFAALPARCPAGMPRDSLAARRDALARLLEDMRAENSAQTAGKAEDSDRHDSDTPLTSSMNGSYRPARFRREVEAEQKSGGISEFEYRQDRPDPAWSGSAQDAALAAGLDRISLGLAHAAAGPALRALLLPQGLPQGLQQSLPRGTKVPQGGGSWEDLVAAAQALLPLVGVPQPLWAEACTLLGRRGAALCVLGVEHGLARADAPDASDGMGDAAGTGGQAPPPIRSPAGYFAAMLARARRGELHLARALHGMAAAGRVA